MTLNASVDELLSSLQQQHAALFAKMGQTTDPKVAQAILRESQEVLHRINIAENLVLIAEAAELSSAVEKVDAADKELTKDLEDIADVARFVDAVTKYLGFVDAALDIAKRVAGI